MWPFTKTQKEALPHGRRGWIEYESEARRAIDPEFVLHLEFAVYVEEILVMDDKSRIKVISISGGKKVMWRNLRERLDGTFVPTVDICFDAFDPIQKAYEKGRFDAELEHAEKLADLAGVTIAAEMGRRG